MGAQGHSAHAESSLSEYVWGMIWSILLTAVSFGLVMVGGLGLDNTTIKSILILAAVLQVFVQLVYFLHMNGSSDQYWNTVTGIFAVLQVVILMGGTLWVMFHLQANMQIGS